MGAHRSIPSEEVPAEVNRMVYGLTATLCLLVFMLDTLAPQGVASGVPYVAAVVLAFYSGSRRVVLATAVICSLLTLFGYVVSTSSGETELWRIVANRSLAIFAIWTTAAISAHFRGELGKRQHRPTTFLAFASLFTFLVLVSMNWLYFRNQEKTLQIVQRETQVATLSGLILYFDEALTMSARMAAETGDLSWEDRYRSHEKELAGALQQAEAIMRQLAVAEGAKTSADANDKLVAMENQVFDLVRHEQLEQASQLLNSSEYTVQKSIYQKGRDEYQERLEQVGRLRATEAEYNM